MRHVLIDPETWTATPLDAEPANEDALVFPEGSLGVWVGFDGADRDYVGGSRPAFLFHKRRPQRKARLDDRVRPRRRDPPALPSVARRPRRVNRTGAGFTPGPIL
jgi:hypothetical protein